MPFGFQQMGGRSGAPRPRGLPAPGVLLGFIVLFTLGLAMLMVRVPLAMSSGIVVALIVFILCFVSTEIGLYLLVFSMLLSPEFGAGGLGGSSGTTASRGVTIRSEDMLLVLLAFGWLAHMAVHKELALVRKTPLNGAIAYYTIACLFSTSMGYITGHVSGITGFFYVLKYVEYFVVYFMVANYLHSRTQIKRFVVALLVTAFIVSLVGIAQIPSGGRVSAPFEGETGEPNTLGGYLMLIGAIVTGLMFHLEDRRIRLTLAGLLVILMVPFLATYSRSSYLGIPFIYFVFMVMHKRKRAVMIGVMVGFVVVGGALMPKKVQDRVMYTFKQQTQAQRVKVGDIALDTSTSARLNSWMEAIEDSMTSPVWGFGVTGYGFLDAQYPRVLVETGLVGLVFFVALIRGVFREALTVFRQSKDPLYRGLATGLIAGLVGLLVHGLGTNTFIIVRIMEPFWLIVGLVVCAEKVEAGTEFGDTG